MRCHESWLQILWNYLHPSPLRVKLQYNVRRCRPVTVLRSLAKSQFTTCNTKSFSSIPESSWIIHFIWWNTAIRTHRPSPCCLWAKERKKSNILFQFTFHLQFSHLHIQTIYTYHTTKILHIFHIFFTHTKLLRPTARPMINISFSFFIFRILNEETEYAHLIVHRWQSTSLSIHYSPLYAIVILYVTLSCIIHTKAQQPSLRSCLVHVSSRLPLY